MFKGVMIRRGLIVVLCLVCLFSFVACNSSNVESGTDKQADDMSQEVSLKWYIMANEPEGIQEVKEEVNRYLKEKINATVDLVIVNSGDYDQRMQMIMAAQEEFDLVWTATWKNSYSQNVMKGAYLELDSLLEQVPALKDFYPDHIWDATRIGGKIYGVPNNQVLYDQPGLWFKKDLVEKYNLDVKNIKKLEDLTPIYQTIKDNEPGIIPLRQGIATNFWKPMTNVEGFYIDENGKVIDRDEESLAGARLMREWNLKGFFPPDVSTTVDETALLKAGKIFSRYNRQLPGVDGKFKIQYNYDVINVPTSDAFLSRNAVQSTLTAISVNSKNPLRALKLVELMQTDKYLFNLLAYGIEGRDYTKDPENPNRIQRSSSSFYIPEYVIGNQFLAYIQPNYEDDVWEQTQKENDEATIDANIGFSFDPTPVQSEIAQMKAVSLEYGPIITNGLEDPDKIWGEYQDKLQKAGKQKVKEEIQRQYDEWKKNN